MRDDDVRAPDFEEVAGGGDLSPSERARLERVHELLIAAGPPAELPPEFQPVAPGGTVVPLERSRRRRILPAALVAAALAAVIFGVGFLVGDRSARPPDPERLIAMTGEGGARASLAIFAKDDAGNWPMEMTVRGLPELPRGRTYELWLTKDGRLADRCGTFAVSGERTVVPLNAPYPLKRYDGWVVTRTGSTRTLLST